VAAEERVMHIGLALVVLLASLTASATTPAVPAPAAAAGAAREWHFRVWLDDQEVGWHRYVVRERGDATEVESRAQFDVRFLFLNAYRYRHEARERWRGDCLDELDARTVTNGKVQQVEALVSDEALIVVRPSGEARLPGCVRSFAYWDPRILDADRLLNSQTGEWLPVRIEARGDDRVTVAGRDVLATRHRLTAPDLQIDLWYAHGHWVALEAPLPGGRTLRYELK
jgi:hypothetical protein